MRIGELLIMNGLITQEQLEKSLQLQKHSFKKIGEILVEEGMITERQLVEALEFQLGIPVINMDEAAPSRNTLQLIHESVARKHCMIPIEQKDGRVKVAMIDPLNQEAIKDVQVASGMVVQPCLATRSELEMAIIDHYGLLDSVKELSDIIDYGLQQNASDIHLDADKEGLVVRYRINQMLEKQKTIPKQLQEAVIARIKTISNMDTSERKLPQCGYIHKDFYNNDFDFRVSTVPTIDGENVVLSLLKHSEDFFKLEDFSFTNMNKQKLEDSLDRGKGLVLIAGPAVSGKSTQLYAILNHMNIDKRKIVSVESPVERRIKGVMQVEVDEALGFTFPYGMRTIMNQDPNLIMVSDIPDSETGEVATRAALSGRLVVGSIHGYDTIYTIRRLLDMGIEPYLIASSLSCIVAQRLVPRICKRCAKSMPASDEESKLFEAHDLLDLEDQKEKSKIGNFRSFVTTNKSSKVAVVRGDGCKLCNNSGYKGFIGVHEVLTIDDGLRELILQKKPIEEFKDYLKENEYKTILYDGLSKAREGLTTVEEVLKAVN
ncbi:GspE/PulE family protein [Alkalihalobacillus sp. TS-13]|uniref:GspE/PulE family protein n=1 Tax=Alkalihalobacillus sp. TS-13 TaxID=2842455 RepID=UPI001C88228D|nr:GspE/PulE family protein [Alkalihalobacillus sp. TS-13]